MQSPYEEFDSPARTLHDFAILAKVLVVPLKVCVWQTSAEFGAWIRRGGDSSTTEHTSSFFGHHQKCTRQIMDGLLKKNVALDHKKDLGWKIIDFCARIGGYG